MGQDRSQQIVSCFAQRMTDVIGIGLRCIPASPSLVDNGQACIDTRAVPREHLPSNGCRKDDVRNLANASEGQSMTLGFWGKGFACDHNEASSKGKPFQS